MTLSTGLGICCSVQSIKARKPRKYISTSSGVGSLFVILYISVELVNIVLPIFQSFVRLYKYYLGLGQTKNQLEYWLCKDDNKLEALEICL
jgi:hypothetical protein